MDSDGEEYDASVANEPGIRSTNAEPTSTNVPKEHPTVR
jgi:hypothetical protein